MAIRRFDPGSVKASTPTSGMVYDRPPEPPYDLYSDFSGDRGYKDKMRIRAHERRLDPLTGEPREGSYPVDFTTASGWDEGPAGIDPTKMDDIDYVRRKMDEHDRLAYEKDAFESAYRTPSTEKRMDSYTGEMVDMPVDLRSSDGEMWSRGKLLEPTTEEEYMSRYMGHDSEEGLDYARSAGMAPPKGLELPEGYTRSLRRELAGYAPPEHLRSTAREYTPYRDTMSMVGIDPAAYDAYYEDIYGDEYAEDPWRSTGFGKWSETL